MIILLLTTQEKVGEKIAGRLRSQYNYIVQTFTNARKFCDAAYDEGPSRIDLLMVDYMSFLNDELNPFERMVAMERVIPFIYYNTPFAKAGHRAEYWYDKIVRHIKSYIPDSKVAVLIRLFGEIDSVISAPDVQPYVRLLNEPPEMADEEAEDAAEEKDLFLENFRRQNGIHNSRFRVLKYLYDRIGEDVREEAICNDLWNEYSERKTGVLYSYISELRKLCSAAGGPRGGRCFAIERSGKRSYRLVMREGEAI
jgi:DNA-binding response OmpR family regulator